MAEGILLTGGVGGDKGGRGKGEADFPSFSRRITEREVVGLFRVEQKNSNYGHFFVKQRVHSPLIGLRCPNRGRRDLHVCVNYISAFDCWSLSSCFTCARRWKVFDLMAVSVSLGFGLDF